MTTNRYVLGTLVRIIGEFIDAVNVSTPIDPSTVSLIIELPDTTTMDLSSTVVRDGVGEYHADYLPSDQIGFYQYEWIGSGSVEIANLGSFFVDQGL